MRTVAYPLLLAAAFAGGCGSPAPAESAPVADDATLTRDALDAYDANKDGSLDATEVGASPALRNAFAALDANRDGKLSKDELQQRFAQYRTAAVSTSTLSVTVKVLLDGRPLAGANVRLVPDRCLESLLTPAAGVTDKDGVAIPAPEDRSVLGVYPGLYTIAVTAPPGTPGLPAKYNTQSTLGREAFAGRGSSTTFELKLSK
jgi:hypothetical protein